MKSEAISIVRTSSDYIFQFAAAGAEKLEGNPICFAARASGLMCSHDGGRTWKDAYATLNAQNPLPTTSVILAPDFEHDAAVFAGLNGAILCSYDGGTKWQRGHLPTPLPAISVLAISPEYEEDGNLFAGTREDGILVARDRGSRWVAWNFGLLDLHILALGISPDFAADETVFAGTESGLFRSTNGGRAWKEVSLPIGFDAVLSLALSPDFAEDGTVLAGTENNGLLISRDHGKSWQLLSRATRVAPVNQILLDPRAPLQHISILLGGALWGSEDDGQTWKAWQAKRLGTCDITAVLALNTQGAGTLVGFVDGTILHVQGKRHA